MTRRAASALGSTQTRAALALSVVCGLAAPPALAWTFTPGRPCLLTQETATLSVVLTYDPSAPLYTIALSRADPFPAAPVFELSFRGGMDLRIGTDRHVLSDGARTLTVTDTGFGNVLNGIGFNTTMTAYIGDESIEVPLAGSDAPLAAFRACEGAPLAV